MTWPTPRHTVTREPFTPGATNAHGDPIDAWGSPVSVAVFAWSPPSPDSEPAEQQRRAVERDLDVYAPLGTVGGPRDRWTVAGVTYLQVGYAEDYSHGPWPSDVGQLRINLKRDEG